MDDRNFVSDVGHPLGDVVSLELVFDILAMSVHVACQRDQLVLHLLDQLLLLVLLAVLDEVFELRERLELGVDGLEPLVQV